MQTRALEVYLYSFLKELGNKKFLLSISGGEDSMALLLAFQQVAPKLKVQYSVVHIHHGRSEDLQQMSFRDQCFKMLQAFCLKNKIQLLSNIQTLEDVKTLPFMPSSEASFRQLRRQVIFDFIKKYQFDFVVYAHHADDLFETRLLRMIRGTGPQGLQSMQERTGSILRPFLKFSKLDLRDYLSTLQSVSVDFEIAEDPSNLSPKYLRNWLRHRWLPSLEKKRPGSLHCLRQSIQSMVDAIEQLPSLEFCFEEGRLVRSEYLSLSQADKRRVLGLFLKQSGFKNYGLSHINELVKRLDVEQKELTFSMLKKRWLANARHIWCESKNKLE